MTTQEFLTDLEEALEVPAGTIKRSDSLIESGYWDSMAALTFMSLADQKLQIAVSGAQIEQSDTIDDLLSLVAARLDHVK
jgi:acyl carrier protein